MFKSNSHIFKTADSNQVLHNDKDNQVIFVGGPNAATHA